VSEMLLLGAGASRGAGVPLAHEMTREILSRFQNEMPLKSSYRVLAFVAGGLLFQQGQEGGNPLNGDINVEDLFNAVRLLAERRNLEAAPFIGSWHTMVDRLDQRQKSSEQTGGTIGRAIFKAISEKLKSAIPQSPTGFASSDVDRAVDTAVRTIGSGRGGFLVNTVGRSIGDFVHKYLTSWADNFDRGFARDSEIERELVNAIQREQHQPGEGEIFNTAAIRMISILRTLVWINTPERVEYLSPLLNLQARQERVVVATLNYDNAVELLCQSKEIPCKVGIEKWGSSRRLDCEGKGIILLKLHGSIDWKYDDQVPTLEQPYGVRTVRQVSPEDVAKNLHPAVIFGEKNKLTTDGPFLDILREFAKELDNSQLVTVVGYSFADAHINEYIGRWLNASPQNKLRVIDPNFARNRNSFALFLRANCLHRIETFEEGAERVLPTLYAAREPSAGQETSNGNKTATP
jgi:hypothetical protein